MPALYTRPIRIDEHFYELQPADQVDLSIELDARDWAIIARVGQHADDKDIDNDVPDPWWCSGSCHAVLFFEDESMYPWHLQEDDEIHARFPVESD